MCMKRGKRIINNQSMAIQTVDYCLFSGNPMNELIQKTAGYVEAKMSGEGSGHDWWHVYRVWQNAKAILVHEEADSFVVEMAALLHDIADWKDHNGDTEIGPQVASEWMTQIGVDTKTVNEVADIIRHLSFKGAGVENKINTIEGKIVQDADRLDAIGAIGIGRTFAFGGSRGRVMYDPDMPPTLHDSAESYLKSNTSPTINHFYEKLFLLKDQMHTQTARSIAEDRHKFMEQFVDRFYAEWNGEA